MGNTGRKVILWVCNTPLPEVQNLVGIKNHNEGWLVGISGGLRKRDDIVFYYAFPQKRFRKTIRKTVNGINFLGFYDCHENVYKTEKEGVRILEAVITEVKPDIIHIFGTELPHALECVYSVPDRKKIIVSLQGLTSEIAKAYVKGIPVWDRFAGRFAGNRYQCIQVGKNDFRKRGKNEKTLLRNVENVIGRTDWDRECVKRINPGCRYYHCSETLRDVFYHDKWDIGNIQRNSIFISQANYPVKGLHIFIAALPLIKKRCSNVMVYVAGHKGFLKDTPYGAYINKLIKKYQVEGNIVFSGYLPDGEIKRQLLKAHVMLMPSLIENSPNSIGEAMLLGTPVVAADVGGIRSILHEGAGYMYPCMSGNEMAGKICRIFKNDNLAMSFSENGQRLAEKLYDKSNNLQKLLKIYDSVFGSNSV